MLNRRGPEMSLQHGRTLRRGGIGLDFKPDAALSGACSNRRGDCQAPSATGNRNSSRIGSSRAIEPDFTSQLMPQANEGMIA